MRTEQVDGKYREPSLVTCSDLHELLAAAEAHKATGEAHETAKDAGKIRNVAPSMMKFPNKPSMKKENYGISGNKVADSLLDAIEKVAKGK